MIVDPAVAAEVATVTGQEALHPAAFSQHKLSFSWKTLLDDSSMSRPSSSWLVPSPTPTYATFIRALPSEVFIAIGDLIRDVTAGISADNKMLSSPFAASSLHQCFKLPSLDDCCPSALFAEMQDLLPHDANILSTVTRCFNTASNVHENHSGHPW
jgi:hypothetical protein